MYISLNKIKSCGFSFYDFSRAEDLYLYDQIKNLTVRKVSQDQVLMEGQFPPDYYNSRKPFTSSLNINTTSNNARYSCTCSQS